MRSIVALFSFFAFSTVSFAAGDIGDDCEALLAQTDAARVAQAVYDDAELRERLSTTIAGLSPSRLRNVLEDRVPDVSALRSMRNEYAQLAAGARGHEAGFLRMHRRLAYFGRLGRIGRHDEGWRRAVTMLRRIPLIAYAVPFSFVTLLRAEESGAHSDLRLAAPTEEGTSFQQLLEVASNMAKLHGDIAVGADDAVARLNARLAEIDAEVRRRFGAH